MVAIMLGADNGFFYAGQVMHFSSPFTVFLIYHKHTKTLFVNQRIGRNTFFFHEVPQRFIAYHIRTTPSRR